MSHMGWLLMIIRVIVIFALFADEVVCKEREELVLAGIFPLTGKGGWLGGVGCLPAALMALDDVNERSQLLPGYKLRLMLNDSECEPGKGIAILYDLLYNEPQKIMMLGPGCSTVTTTIAEAAKMWNLVVMSYGSSSPALSNRDRFTTFFRTHPSANLNNPALIAIFQHYKWKKINIIQEAEEVFVSNVENLESLCKEAKIDIVTRQSFLKDPADAVRNLNRSDARIIVGLFYETSARKVFCEAYKNYLYGRRVVWLIIGWYADTWYMEPDSEVNCTANEMKTALEGHLTTESLIKNLKSPITESGLSTEAFFDALKAKLKENCTTCTQENTPGFVEAPLAYDAVWAIAKAFNRTIAKLAQTNQLLEHFTYSNKEMSQVIMDSMEETKFEGVSGSVFFEKGDRIAPTQIEQMRNGQYKILGYYDPSPHKKEIDWINRRDQSRWIGGKAPLDETLIKPRLRTLEPFLFWSMVSLAGFGIALSICCFVFNFLHRMRRLIQMSHPNINNLMLVGIVLCLVTVVLLGLDGESIPNSWYSMLCQARAWILMTGFTFSYGSMFAKIWNVHRLSTQAKKESKREARRSAGRGSFRTTSFAEIRTFSSLVQTQKVESWHLYVVVIGLLIVDVLILSLWATINPLSLVQLRFPTEPAKDTDDDVEYEPQLQQCASENDKIWMGIIFAYKGLFLIFGLFLAYETRSVKIKELNDSRFVGMSIYNVVVLCIITAPVTLIINRQHNAKFAFVALSIMFCSFLSMGLIFVPKILEIYRRKTEQNDSKKLEDSLPSREEEEKHQKLLAENEELKKQIQEKEEKVKILHEIIKDRAVQRARLTQEHQKANEAKESKKEDSTKQLVAAEVLCDRHSDSALPSSTGA